MLGLLMPNRSADTGDRSPISDFWYGPASRSVASGVSVTPEVAMTYSAVWAATRILSGTPGWLPLNLYRKKGDRGKMIAVDDKRNTLVETRPNPMMIPMLWKSQGFAQQINAGNAYFEIQRNKDGSSFALWPIHHTRVKPKIAVLPGGDEELYYEVKNNDHTTTEIQAADILHFPSLMSEDGICGKGVIHYARESIGMGIATERSGASFFGAGGIPRVVVESPKKWSPESRQNFRKEWKEIYGGPEGDKVGVMDEGSKLHMLNITQQDSQFLETRGFNVTELARWYGVPPHLLQDLSRSTFSNIEHQSIDFVMHSLMPWMTIWEQELDAKLLSDVEQQSMFFRFNVLALLRADAKTRSEYLKSLVNSAIITRNEARWEEDYNEAEGGDTFLVQGAMVALDDEGMPQAPAASAIADPAVGPMDDDTDDPAPAADEPPDDTAKAIAALALGLQQIRDQLTAAKSDPREKVLRQSARTMLVGALARMIRKETTGARREAGKPKSFLKWLDEFYAPATIDLFATELQPACDSLRILGANVTATGIAEIQVATSRAALLELSGTVSATELPAAVESLATQWEAERAEQIAETILPKEKVGA